MESGLEEQVVRDIATKVVMQHADLLARAVTVGPDEVLVIHAGMKEPPPEFVGGVNETLRSRGLEGRAILVWGDLTFWKVSREDAPEAQA